MKNRITLLIIIVAGFSALKAQNQVMNVFLLKALRSDATKSYPVLVKGNIAFVKQFTEARQGLFKYHCGEISSIVLTGSDLTLLAGTGKVSRIEYYERTAKPLDDSSIVKNNILKIHNGVSPLPQAYDGTGVTFGLVDTGIDWNHPDFKDSTTNKTRIKWIWDQTKAVAANTPQPYNYGQEWDNTKIDSGLCTHDDIYDVGHGTKVAGIGAGNGNTDSIFRGHAPKADIICVALNFSATGPVVLDGINYLVTKANAMGQPFVLNLSIGDYYGSHDGKDLQAQAIDALFGNVPGRSVVAAAGNAGNYSFHLGYGLSPDTNLTFIQTTNPQTQFLLYADTANFKQAKYSIGVHDNGGTWRYVGNIGFRDIFACLGTTVSDTLKNASGQRIGIVQTTGSIQANTYEILFDIVADSINYFWTLESTGQGNFDAWNFDFYNGPLPSLITLPRMFFYKEPDSLQTICSSFQCSDHVITVANYTERTGHISCQHSFWQMPGPYDTLLFYCSRGPTRDNRIKPDIAATGDNILTTCQLFLCNYMAVTFPTTNQVITEDTMHITFSGTSSACPAVAGFVALYLQKNPTATSLQVKNAITACAMQDYYTGSALPNNSWGYGKLDGYNAMTCGTSMTSNPNYGYIQVFPNPAHDEIQFSLGNVAGVSELKLYSILGNEVKSVSTGQKNIRVFVGNLPQGLYLYKILNGSSLVGEGKFIKE